MKSLDSMKIIDENEQIEDSSSTDYYEYVRLPKKLNVDVDMRHVPKSPMFLQNLTRHNSSLSLSDNGDLEIINENTEEIDKVPI